MEVKIGVQNVARELSVDTEQSPDEVLTAVNSALESGGLFSVTDDKERTVAVPADKLAYVYFTDDKNRKVGFAK